MELGLKGKVAVITGGSSGIGLAAALEFAREGCKVAICGKSQAKLEAAVEDFCQEDLSVYTEGADVSVPNEIDRFAGNIVARFGRIDVWVNNAGIGHSKALLELTMEEWDMVIRTNLSSVFWGIRTAAGHMMKSGGGAIINTSSFAAITPHYNGAAYAASKSGLNGLTKVAAGELAPCHIRVNSVLPGVFDTPILENRFSKDDDLMVSKMAMQRIGKPAELAKVYAFLASDAASYITGANFEVSGGKLCIQDPRAGWDFKWAQGGGATNTGHDKIR
jgi:NAD(P)-dependent dehydrogenase (short-subunit alcohol dehydrogenase family)